MLDRAVLLLALLLPTVAQQPSDEGEPPVVAKVDRWVAKARSLAADAGLGESVGDAGLGFAAGTCLGFACKRVQSLVVNSLVVGAGAVGGACLLGWTAPEDVAQRAREVADGAISGVQPHLRALRGRFNSLDLDGDGDVDGDDSRALYSLASKRKELAGGFLGGALIGYRLG